MELKKYLKLVLLGFFFQCFSIQNIKAQTNYSITNITQGLPSVETYSVVQDDDGFIWVATDRGICRYDGIEFTVYGLGQGLNDPVVFKLVKAGNQLWFQCYNGDIGRIVDHKIEIVKNYPPGIFIIHEIYGIQDRVILTWSKKNRKICYDEYNIDGKLVASNCNSYKYMVLHSVAPNQYIGIGNDSLIEGKIRVEGKYQTEFTVSDEGKPHWKVISDTNAVYFVTGKEVSKVNSKGVRTYRIPDIATTGSLIDKANNLWLCTYSGLIRFNKNRLTQSQSYLKGTSPTSVCQDHEGNYWITTLNNGMYYLKASKLKTLAIGKVELIKSSNKDLVALRNRNEFVKVLKDTILYTKSKGTIEDYIVTDSGIKFTYRFQPEKKVNSLASSEIELPGCKTFKSRSDSVWLFNGGLISIKTGNRIISEKINPIHRRKAICYQSIDDSSLVLSMKDGLYKMKYSNFQNTTLTPVSPISLKCLEIGKKRHFGAIKGIGLLVFDTSWNPIDTLNIASGLSSVYFNDIISLNGGDTLILAGSEGVDVIYYSPEKTKILGGLTVRDGLLSNEILSIHSFQDKLYIGSSNGLQSIEETEVYNKTDNFNAKLNLLSINGIHTINRNEIKFPPGSKTLALRFYALSYSSQTRPLLEYRILELDSNWNSTYLNQVEYANMSPREYHFEFRIMGQKEIKKINILLEAAFYETNWFKGSILFLLLFSIFYGWYKRSQIKYERLVRKLENERLRQSALMTRLNPHFLFNTLGGLQTLILQKETMKAVTFVSGFSDLMRHILKRSGERYTRLSDEKQFIDSLVKLENLKYDLNTVVKWSYDESVDPSLIKIPSMFLQPLVENSIKHGMIGYRNDGSIEITVHIHSKNVIDIRVQDDGRGLQIKNEQENDRVHSSNIIANRIKLMQDTYNKNYVIEFYNLCDFEREKTGTRVELKLPYVT